MAERQGAMIVSWGNTRVPVPKAMEVLANSLAYYDGLVKEGRLAGYRLYAPTTRLGGYLIIEGPLSELAAISVETESLKLVAQAGAVVDDLRIELTAGGSADEATNYYLEGMAAVADAGLS